VVKDYGEFEILGRTRDDAAGEAFDKVARAVGLGYPGGPKVDKTAREGNPEAIRFPRAKVEGAPYDFSFSGLKSAVLNYMNHAKMTGEEICVPDLAASFQAAVVDVLVSHTVDAAKKLGYHKVAMAGGVASNSALRAGMRRACKRAGIHTAIETCGYTRRENLLRLAEFTDLFLYDIKHIDSVQHHKWTGVHNERILDALASGVVPVVAGFQGIDANDDITTLGRGGSDTTAVAIAWGINADVCEIYSDVDGVYTTDPRIAPRARKLDSICYDDMLELSSAGSGVLQSRAVEFARKWKVVIHSRSAFSDAEGTYVKEEYEMEEAVITGIASDTSEVKVTVRRVPDAPSVAAKVFSALAANNVNLDMIIQNVSEAGFTDISYTTPAADLPRAIETMERIVPEIGAREFIVDEDIAKVSLVGTGMKSSPGVASRTFQTLGDNNINIMAISTSPIRLSMIVDAAQAVQAVQCLHTAFGLDSDDLFVETQLSAEEIAAKMKKGR